ncbi:cobalamin biosynthesis protein, partial [Desulfovibrio sp. OttesenSCG-928-G15]|nr:cobalamin biosynthesis protein [Desulfovibrio sp. OttesenSCG-928-G15]
MAWLPFAALALDLLLPDPKRLPHPVQAIGRLADFLEPRVRKLPNPVLAGGMALTAILLLTGWAAFMLTILPLGAGLFFSLYLAWAGLALGSLVRHGEEALHSILRAESTPDSLLIFQARRDVQKLVSRNTEGMNIDNLYRSLAESLSENFNDAFVAPFFWLCLGGPVGLWLYKAAST